MNLFLCLKEIQKQIEDNPIKPDTIKTNEILQQTLTPMKKKEAQKTIEVKDATQTSTTDVFAPIPVNAPIE